MPSSRHIRQTIGIHSPTDAQVGLHLRPSGWQCADMSGRIDDGGTRVRRVRLALGLSQRQFAACLGVSLESYRPWDAGRRETPEDLMRRALALVKGANVDAPLPLAALSRILRINKGTLRAAAHDGRLRVT